MSNQKLELTWIGKDKRPKLEPRILLENPEKSYHAKQRYSDKDIFDNRLIFGDNLLALKALEQEFTGKVKCVFIDPPYNTGSAFTHYDDGLEHSIWLSLMRDRLEIIRRLLSEDGSLWITIDDNECHYLKVLCDELFSRNNFLSCSVWNHSVQSKGYSGKFSVHHNYILVYQKSSAFVLKDLPRQDKHNVNYANPDSDPRGPWRSGDVRNSLIRPNLMYDIKTPNGSLIQHPPKGWRFSRDTFERELSEGKIKFSDDEKRIIRKIYLADQEGRVPETIWFAQDVGTTREASSEVRAFVEGDFFDTPKPERLLERVLTLSTNPGDLILDSFAGSGTTGAVAHKMGRRWIMIELGEHCHTHIIPRLKKVIDGEDQGGISKTVNWQGGGGFRYYQLAPSLIVQDRWGNPVINPQYNPTQLTQALCKIEGFIYQPSEIHWWQQGYSSERDFIYVTTQNLSVEQLQLLADEVGGEQSLLVCCAAFHGITNAKAAERWPNLTLKKIPKMILARCEWSHDDYSLNVAALPLFDDSMTQSQVQSPATNKNKTRKKMVGMDDLFGGDE